jgi:uncharacterized protein YeaO (DUF488 family)
VSEICIKRAYDPPSREDGARILVDRLWPRGVKKEKLQLTSWLKEVAPSDALRKWFNHDPAKWPEFQRRYFTELRKNPEACQPLLDAAKKGTVTLLFGAKDEEHNNAVALKIFLSKKRKA